jgi:hypothetical protein
MKDEISQNGGEKVQRCLHDSYNGSNDDIHSTKSFKNVQKSKNGMPQNFVSVDKTHLNDVSKLLERQVLGIDLPKFSDDDKQKDD